MLLCLKSSELAKEHITSRVQKVSAPSYRPLNSVAPHNCVRNKCLRNGSLAYIYEFPVTVGCEVTAADIEQGYITYRRLKFPEDSNVTPFMPSWKDVTHGSTKIATNTLVAAYLAKYVTKRYPVGLVRRD